MSFKIKTSKDLPEVKTVTESKIELQSPDGGWGWAVCFAAFMTNFTVTGMTCSSGVILLALIDLYNESISKTSLVGSILVGGTMFGSPLALPLLACKASHRQVIMLAGIISSASAVASAFAPNIETMIFTYGVLVGVFLAGAFFAANMILGCYFTTKRALALGIANSGAGCGAIVLPFLTEKIISFYGIRGTFLLIAGLFLNLNVYGALCRPLKPVIKQKFQIPESRRNSSNEQKSVTNLGFIPEDGIISDTQSEKSVPSSEHITEEIEIPNTLQMRRLSAFSEKAPSDFGELKSIFGDRSMYVPSSEHITEEIEIPNTLQMRRLSAFSEKAPSDFGELKSIFGDRSMFKNKYFYLLLFTFLFWSVGDSLIIYYPSYAESVGLSRQQGALVVSVFGAMSTISQIITGILIDVLHVPNTYLFCATLCIMSLSIAFIPYCQTFETIILDAGIVSAGFCPGITLRIVMTASVLGMEKMSAGFSIMSIILGIGFTVNPVISGIVYDLTHSFAFVFNLDAAFVSVGIILSFGLIYAQKKGKFSK